ncbi:sigma-70 family RNA polymerase sigma factor [Coprothermobacteraceae bacterium]|nr:sigma-70 family RNA polymerase sigma factor [Coprothermobacteraceae bacterium]
MSNSVESDDWGKTLERLRPRLKWFFLSRVKDPEEADELTQQVLVKAWEKRESLEEQRSFEPWVFAIAKNVLMDFYRHQSLIVEEQDIDLKPYDGGPDWDVAADLQSALSRLPQHMRTVIELRFYQGLSVNETASALGKTPTAVKLLQYRALRALRELLKP